MKRKKNMIELEFEDHPWIRNGVKIGIIVRASRCWKGTYCISNEAIVRGLAVGQRKRGNRALTELVNNVLEKEFIEYIESESDLFVSRYATKRTMVVSPLEFVELIRLRDDQPFQFTIPTEADYNLYKQASEVKIGWFTFTLERQLIDDMMQAIQDLYSRSFISHNTVILIPPNRLAKPQEELEIIKRYDGSELFQFGGHHIYVSYDIDKVIAIDGGTRK